MCTARDLHVGCMCAHGMRAVHCTHTRAHFTLHVHCVRTRLQVITPSVRPWVLLCFPGDRVTLEAAEEP